METLRSHRFLVVVFFFFQKGIKYGGIKSPVSGNCRMFHRRMLIDLVAAEEQLNGLDILPCKETE